MSTIKEKDSIEIEEEESAKINEEESIEIDTEESAKIEMDTVELAKINEEESAIINEEESIEIDTEVSEQINEDESAIINEEESAIINEEESEIINEEESIEIGEESVKVAEKVSIGERNKNKNHTVGFPTATVRRIMAICAAAEDEEDPNKEKGKGNMIITKEAVYLTSLAAEHFVSVIGNMAASITESSKKKTLTLDHLRRAVSETDAFAFLEGCFQPSIIIGD